MAESFSVEAILSAVDRNFSGTFKNIADSASKVGANFEKSTKPAGNFVSTVSKIAGAIGLTKVVGAIGAGVKSMAGELDASSKAWQTFESNMKFLGKTPAEISTIEKSLQSYAQKTIYSSSDMASAYAQFASVGVKGVGRLVKGMGGLAAATDDPKQAMKTLMEQGTQMAAKPMVQWADFRLMLEQTPAGMAAVAKAMGMSTKQLVTEVQNGKITTQQFFDGIEKAGNSKAFQKMATSYKTVGEAMDGLQETLANKLQPAWQAMSKIAIGAISGIIDKIGAINFDSVLASIGRFFSPFSTLILNIRTQLSNLGKGESMSGLISILQGVGSVLHTIWDLVGSLANVAFVNLIGIAQKVGDAFNSVFGGGQLSGVFDGIKQAATDFGYAAMGALTTVGNFIANLPWKMIFEGVKVALTGVVNVLKPIAALVKAAFANDIVKSFAVALLGAFASFKLFMGISSIVGVIKSVVGGFTTMITIVKNVGGVFNALKMVMGFMSPTGWIVAGIAAVVAGLTYFFTQTETGQQLWAGFVDFLKSAWEGLVGIAQTVWTAISSAFTGAVAGVQSAWSAVGSFFSNLWAGIQTAAVTAWTTISTTLSAIWQGIVSVATTIWNGIATFFTGLWNGIVAVATAVWTTFGGSLTTIWNGIVSVASGVWNMIKTVIMGPILIVIDLLTGNWTQLGADLQMIWNNIVSAAAQIWNGLVQYFSGIWQLIVTYAQTVWNGFVNILTSLWNGVVSTAQNIWNGLSNFMSSLWQSIVSTASNAWNGLKSTVINLANGIKDGAINAWNGLKQGVSNAISGLVSWATNAWNGLKSTVVSIANGIKNGAINAWNGMVDGVRNIIGNVKGAFNALSHINLFSAGKAILDGFFNGLKSVWNGIKNFVGGIGDWIRKHKGPMRVDKKLLIPAGAAIMKGLNGGLTSGFDQVQNTVSGMSSAIADSFGESSLGSTINSANRQLQSGIQANLSANVANSQPTQIALNIGGTEYRAFVRDITQQQNIDLEIGG